MLQKEDLSIGKIQIAENVVEIIAGLAIADFKEVLTVNRNLIDKGFTKLLSKNNNYGNGIKVEIGGNEARINIYVLVKYGVRIPDIALQIQDKIKNTVESMTGLSVNAVNVYVQGLHIPQDVKQTVERKSADEQT